MYKKPLFFSFLIFNFSFCFGQYNSVSISGKIKDSSSQETLPFAHIELKSILDSNFVSGAISNENGTFILKNILPEEYILGFSFIGYQKKYKTIFIGKSSEIIDLGTLYLIEDNTTLENVVITAKQDDVSAKMEKKTYSPDKNISQKGGSALQAMENLPGITVQDNKVQLRGSDKIIVLIDGKQSALTGFGSQSGLDNIPASSIERIEIINNPSSKYDANGNAGIINIILKKEHKEGFNGKVGLAGGLGALWIKKNNLPTIRPQYQNTPKINPTLSLNYRKNKYNIFLQVDDLYTQTLNKNEFVTRTYDDGTVIQQQTKRNRNTNFFTSKIGVDYQFNKKNQLTFSALFGSEYIIDHGDEPFFNGDLNNRVRLWKFVEDELKTTASSNLIYEHRFNKIGRKLTTSYNYTFHRENEKYTFNNILPTYSGVDAFKLLSDENVHDFKMDYTQPLKIGKIETGVKFRYRNIPTNMQFIPGVNSPLDTNAGGWATYNETIPAVYGNYSFENKKLEGEIGLRFEYVKVNYLVNPNHNTYKSDGYNYFQPFPSMRLGYKFNDKRRISFFYNRRVDRPNEVDIRIFPKYDDAEIIKVGNPSLKPQYTNSLEVGFKNHFKKGYLYLAGYERFAQGTITRISTTAPGSTLIYAVFQNAGKSYNTGIEALWSHDVSKKMTYNFTINIYHNQIDAFTINNKYPIETVFSADKQEIISGNAKLNLLFHLKKEFDIQITAIYLAPDIIPQGTINQRFTMNLGVKKNIQKGKGEFFFNASDLFNTMIISTQIRGNNFNYTSSNYYETQVFRLGYSYKF
ncbi:TonB-dependent receptor [Crocinitomicaceae bacterium]|nr:TonB-dependent receptor [Crocinitomicaceae bacterium]